MNNLNQYDIKEHETDNFHFYGFESTIVQTLHTVGWPVMSGKSDLCQINKHQNTGPTDRQN